MGKKTICFILFAAVMLISSCGPGAAVTASQAPRSATATAMPTALPAPTAKPAPTAAPSPAPVPLPSVTLGRGDFYFSVDKKNSFLFSRNVAGYRQTDYSTYIGWSKLGGSSFVRIQLDSWEMGYTKEGKADEAWAARWDKVFDTARENGIYVLPVFSGWFDWNDGNPDYGYPMWYKNPLNEANGGPVKSPKQLFEKGSDTQTMRLG